MELDFALTNIASVHQQHSIKCYLAIQSLKGFFTWSDLDWEQVASLVRFDEPRFDVEILKSSDIYFDVVPRRRHWILSHAIYPHSYFTMLEWFNTAPSDEIFNFYMVQARQGNQYLSHNISILIAFEKVWKLLSTEWQKLRFIERFCEFVTTTFYRNNLPCYQVKKCFKPVATVDIKILSAACLDNPGFWGHNLIAFAWMLKHESSIRKQLFNGLLLNLYEQCNWEFDDELDNPCIESTSVVDACRESLESACRKLLLTSTHNLHQITLTDAVVFLFNMHWMSQSQKKRLIDILEHYAKI
ncbi:hypothetical protein [Shewanella zhangzhouensis]|uniref:hypothetical protein n=1 Tax=Shewanella zhangzhouensis TaxID=2864213 RepID=UPI001C661ED9|nr:hypothetical protein [Shewanella zhangzhouensis]QYK05851.1 hypothetical protein K0H63_03140 [Shewanella zhangzhouensis]